MNKIRILIACVGPRRQTEIAAEIPTGCTLQQALTLLAPQIAASINGEKVTATGVWGKVRPPHYVLRDGDRIEIYRPLKADPKQARRERVEEKRQRRS